MHESDFEFIRVPPKRLLFRAGSKDVLEVACMRGGGARYVANALGPSSYLATDLAERSIQLCVERHGEDPLVQEGRLRYEVADATGPQTLSRST